MDDPVSLAVCSMSPSRSEYEEFISKLENHGNVNVTFCCIASDVQRESRVFCQYDAVILIHSIARGRLSITDVQDAQYDEFLPRLSKEFGPSRIVVLVHGLSDPEASMEIFANRQPTTMRCSQWVKLCRSLQDEDVTSMVNLFLAKVQESPKPAPGWPTLPTETEGSLQDSQRHPQVEHITATKVTYSGDRWSLDMPSIDFIMCAQACTRDSLLQTLKTEAMQNMIHCLCFEQTQDGWQHITSDNSRTDPSKTDPVYDSLACMHSAIFIYRDKIPIEFNDDTLEDLKDIVNDKAQTEPVLVAMQGVVDDVCLNEILDISLSCTDEGVHIVRILPRVQGQSSERDHPKTETLSVKDKMELELKQVVALKEQFRSGIRELEEEMSECRSRIGALKGNITRLEKEKSQLSSAKEDERTTLQAIKKEVYEATEKIKEQEKVFQIHLDQIKEELEKLAETIASQKAHISEVQEKYAAECKKLEEKKSSAQYRVRGVKGEAAAIDKSFTTGIDKPTPDSNMRDNISDEDKHTSWHCCLCDLISLYNTIY
ncbi:uncharacterized protein LOC100889737 [Strongylocentrotus purpuratus]|uniref:Uncharacterized protein n=1 Tax=Strongylocentrotus purpuratus TaxID=7668 RepID=A0A7M7GK19_STRPU|nr:uncharacterized protein LOC100889737 [Strongylocentrotus purpuratus]